MTAPRVARMPRIINARSECRAHRGGGGGAGGRKGAPVTLVVVRQRGAGLDFLRQWVGVILVVAGLARAFVLVAHDPLVGYANQHDMHRTSACIGLFPVKESAVASAPPEPVTLSAVRPGTRPTRYASRGEGEAESTD